MEIFNKKSVDDIRLLLSQANKIVITAHYNPDGDALGSSLALYNYFKANKECRVILPNNIPDTFKWMPGCDDIIIYSEENAHFVTEADVIFILDYNNSARVDKMQKLLEESHATKIMIDHHPQPQQDLCKYVFSDPSAAATCELLYLLIEHLGFNINNDSAICLFTGLTTDTGCFQFNCTSKRTFEVAAKLSGYSIDRTEIIHHIFDSYSEGRMRLQGYVLSNKLIVLEKYHTAYITLTKAEADKFDYHVGDTEGFVNLPLSIKHVQFSAFFMERDGIIRCSFRSKGNFKVNYIAEKFFNGGGHDNAAGGKSFKPLDDVVKRFVSLLPKITKQIQDK